MIQDCKIYFVLLVEKQPDNKLFSINHNCLLLDLKTLFDRSMANEVFSIISDNPLINFQVL